MKQENLGAVHTHTHRYNVNDKKGITLIALVITIIVLLILAGVSINMISGDEGIATQASSASEKTRAGEVSEQIGLAVAENQMAKYEDGEEITKEDVISELHENGKLTDAEVEALKTENKIEIGGVEVDFSKLPGLNQYGFYFDKEYVCRGASTTYGGTEDIRIIIYSNNTVELNSTILNRTFNEGSRINEYDFADNYWITIESLEYNKVYTGKATFDADASCWHDDSGIGYFKYVVSGNLVKYENNKVDVGNGSFVLNFSNNGNTFSMNQYEFSIEE